MNLLAVRFSSADLFLNLPSAVTSAGVRPARSL
jgi:hypothetical protein